MDRNHTTRILLLIIFSILLGAANLIAEEIVPNDTCSNDPSKQLIIQSDSMTTDSGAVQTVASEEAGPLEPPESRPKPPGILDFLLTYKFMFFAVLMIAGLFLLFIQKINLWVRVGMMAVAFVLYGLDFGISFPLHPSPMCATTKLFMFKFTLGKFFPAFLALFVAMIVPSLFGRKLFCGWVCPLGALQELVNKIPHKLKWKNFNFTAFNTVRFAFLILFVLTFFSVKNHIGMLGTDAEADITSPLWTAYSSYNVYEPVNFFELLHWNIDTLFIIMMGVLVVASLIIYRPFCYAICPVGALTWLCERIAPGRVRIDHNKCTMCGNCEERSPCPTIKKLLDETTKVLPDCTSCGECLGYCDEDAIKFGFKS